MYIFYNIYTIIKIHINVMYMYLFTCIYIFLIEKYMYFLPQTVTSSRSRTMSYLYVNFHSLAQYLA